MPMITVDWIAGRTPQQKAELAKAITQAFVAIAKVSSEDVWIVFRDVPRSDWAMAGKLLQPPATSTEEDG
jgi:4-oxalocrotonate tautomerase